MKGDSIRATLAMAIETRRRFVNEHLAKVAICLEHDNIGPDSRKFMLETSEFWHQELRDLTRASDWLMRMMRMEGTTKELLDQLWAPSPD